MVDQHRWAVIAEIDEDEVLQSMAKRRPRIIGLMLFLYSLALASFWYIRPGDWGGANILPLLDAESEPYEPGDSI